MSVFEMAAALVPWVLIAGFWIFVIWAVVALIGVLKEMLAELRAISESLQRIGGSDAGGTM